MPDGFVASALPMDVGSVRSSALRVLHVHSGNLWGGVETILLTLAAERHTCDSLLPEFAVCFRGPLEQRLSETGVPLHGFGEVRLRSPLQVSAARRRLAALLRERSFDVVITHSAWAHTLFGPVVRRSPAMLAYWAHDTLDGAHWLQRWASRTPPDLVIANSAFTAGGVRHVFPGARVQVLYAPLALALHPVRSAAEVRQEFVTPAEAVVIVQVSRLEGWKGHGVLLEALGRLREVPGWYCWIAGGVQRPAEWDYLRRLQDDASARGIGGRVRFVGHRDDVGAVLRAADVFCHPNAAPEPFGLVLVEALAAGLPVVAAGSGGAFEILDASCGELVPPGDPAALATVLARLVSDRGERRRLGAGGPARAAALCDPARQLQALAALVAAALAAPRAS